LRLKQKLKNPAHFYFSSLACERHTIVLVKQSLHLGNVGDDIRIPVSQSFVSNGMLTRIVRGYSQAEIAFKLTYQPSQISDTAGYVLVGVAAVSDS
jgi:hypothetical protein